MKRLAVFVSACALVASVAAGGASADPPEVTVEHLGGEQIRCTETGLTMTSVQLVSREHVHELRSGLFHVIFTGVARRVRLEDEEGNTYRAVGSAHGNFRTPNPEEEGGEVGFFRVKVVIVGKGGVFGKVDFGERRKRNGESRVVNRGDCEFVE